MLPPPPVAGPAIGPAVGPAAGRPSAFPASTAHIAPPLAPPAASNTALRVQDDAYWRRQVQTTEQKLENRKIVAAHKEREKQERRGPSRQAHYPPPNPENADPYFDDNVPNLPDPSASPAAKKAFYEDRRRREIEMNGNVVLKPYYMARDAGEPSIENFWQVVKTSDLMAEEHDKAKEEIKKVLKCIAEAVVAGVTEEDAKVLFSKLTEAFEKMKIVAEGMGVDVGELLGGASKVAIEDIERRRALTRRNQKVDESLKKEMEEFYERVRLENVGKTD